MSEDKIRYDILVSDAVRGLIRTVLQRVQKRGLPGDHHFFITFDTKAPGTILSKRLKEQYPEEMTVVLQYQFWDLMVYEDRFEVKLSFNTIPERLVVPFAAIKGFLDPSVQFGFSPSYFVSAGAHEKAVREAPTGSGAEAQDLAALPGPETSLADRNNITESEDAAHSTPEPDADESARESATVVELDLFRKK